MTDHSPITIKFGGYQNPNSVHTRGVEVFGRALKDQLGAEIEFEFDADIIQSGFKANDLLTQVEDGTLSMCYFSASYLADRVSEFALLDLPFMFQNRGEAYGVLDGPLKAHLSDRLTESTGFKLMDLWDNGFRQLTTNVRPIHTPEDCKELVIRTLFSDLHGEVFSALGFTPMPLDVKDLMPGIEGGTITAQENPLTNTYNFGVHHHHKYITLTSHFFGAVALLCNAEIYASWPAHVQSAITESAKSATAAQREFAAAEDSNILAKLAQTDVEVIELSHAEQQQFITAVQPIIEAQKEIFGDELFSLALPEQHQ